MTPHSTNMKPFAHLRESNSGESMGKYFSLPGSASVLENGMINAGPVAGLEADADSNIKVVTLDGYVCKSSTAQCL